MTDKEFLASVVGFIFGAIVGVLSGWVYYEFILPLMR